MRALVRLALCGTFLVACTPFALADAVTVTGNVSFSPDLLSFAPPFATTTDTGIFANFAGGTVNYLLGTVQYTLGIPQTTEAFTITALNGDVLAFYDEVNDPIQSFNSNGDLQVTLNETGYYTFNGGPAMAGTFDLGFVGTSANGASDLVPFSGTGMLLSPTAIAATPEPNSMLLLGSGLLGGAALVRRRRQA